DACQLNPVCTSGQCLGTQLQCPPPPQCHLGYCDKTSGECKTDRVAPESAMCVLSECYTDTHCDTGGNCIGTPKQDGTPCTAPASCADGEAFCVSASCICASDYDAGVPGSGGVDLAEKGSDNGGGCEAAGTPSAPWLLLVVLGLLFLVRLARQ